MSRRLAGGGLLTGLLLGGAPARAEVELGLGLDFATDGPASATSTDARTGPGGGLRVPLRLGLGEGAWLEVALHGHLGRGQDRVEWTQYDGAVRYYSDDHWTLVQRTALLVGPVVDLGRSERLQGKLGARAGAAAVAFWHSFHGDAAVLLDPTLGETDHDGAIDPYSLQAAPVADLSAGLRVGAAAPFAIELEAGYTVSFLSEAALEKARPELQAVRTATGLDAFRFGVGAIFPL